MESRRVIDLECGGVFSLHRGSSASKTFVGRFINVSVKREFDYQHSKPIIINYFPSNLRTFIEFYAC